MGQIEIAFIFAMIAGSARFGRDGNGSLTHERPCS